MVPSKFVIARVRVSPSSSQKNPELSVQGGMWMKIIGPFTSAIAVGSNSVNTVTIFCIGTKKSNYSFTIFLLDRSLPPIAR